MTISPARPDTLQSVAPVQSIWGADGFGFDDLVDIVNPLHHIPGVAQVYRGAAGDDIGVLPRLIGGFLFGGPVGLAVATVSAGVEAGTGREPGEQMIALALGDAPPAAPTSATAVAQAYAAPSPADYLAPRPEDVLLQRGATATPSLIAPSLIGAEERLLYEIERASAFGGDGKSDLVV